MAMVARTCPSPAPAPNGKRGSDISDAFASLSGRAAEPLPDRYREIKLGLVAGREDEVVASWKRLLKTLRAEIDVVARAGSSIVPVVEFNSLEADLRGKSNEIKRRGVAVIRGVIPESEARAYKFEIEDYVRQNPQTRGYPADTRQVLELYWSAPQLRARLHQRMFRTHATLLATLCHASDTSAVISLHTPLSYADRLRIRQPGDQFALGPHRDGGSVERWDPDGYGKGHVYDAIFDGEWDTAYDAFDVGGRATAFSNLHGGIGPCSMFRMFQGWLAVSRCAPGEGTLLVAPLLREATAYSLLRPFFRPLASADTPGLDRERFLDAENWVFTAADDMTSDLQGATEGVGHEFTDALHPHLELDRLMVPVPAVRPGDFVIWHGDTIHGVESLHRGEGDSSVLYIPVCPTTEGNARYLTRQRDAFRAGFPSPDFGGGEGESEHVGRPTEDFVRAYAGAAGAASMGLSKLAIVAHDTPGGKDAVHKANMILGF